MRWFRLILLGAVVLACGCNGIGGTKSAWQQGASGAQPYETQITDLKVRNSKMDADNQDLQKQLAITMQQSQVYKDQVTQYRKEVEHLAKDLKETQLARGDAERRVEVLQASTQHRGGAIITANNSIRQSLGVVSIPGVDVRQEDNAIAIELPSDQLFRTGTNQLQPNGTLLLDQVADAIVKNYPRQRIGIEGHLDSGESLATNTHQAAALQASSVFDYFSQRSRIPAGQMFWGSFGSNHPRVSNSAPSGRAKNRRVVVVIYPDTVEGK